MRLGIGVADFSWPGGPEQISPNLSWITRTADEAGAPSTRYQPSRAHRSRRGARHPVPVAGGTL